jgi:hypothetical protein
MMRHLSGLRQWTLWLLFALVCLQTLTVMHRTVHRESVVQRVTQTQLAQTVVIQKLTSTLNCTSDASKFFADLWGEHKSLTDCQLFDQACPDALQNALHIDNYITAPVIWLGLVLLERFALFERFYAARGPPVRSLI